jgi:hypothetical protein
LVLFSESAIDFLLSFIRRFFNNVFQLPPRKSKINNVATRYMLFFLTYNAQLPDGGPIRSAIFPNPLGSHYRLSLNSVRTFWVFMHT